MALTKVFENTLNNVKYLKLYCQNWVESTEEMAILAFYPGIPYSNLETAGETVQKLESPGLSRRGDGTASGTSSSANIFIKVKVHLK